MVETFYGPSSQHALINTGGVRDVNEEFFVEGCLFILIHAERKILYVCPPRTFMRKPFTRIIKPVGQFIFVRNLSLSGKTIFRDKCKLTISNK